MPWDDDLQESLRGRGFGSDINAPVTIVEGRGGERGGCGPTISLEAYTDYVLRKNRQRQEWSEGQGPWPYPGNGPPWGGQSPPWGPNMHFGTTVALVDTPLKAIGSTILDSQYILSMGLVCKVPAAGSGTITLTVTYYDVLTGSTTQTISVSLTAAAAVDFAPINVRLLAGSTVTVSVQNAGAYNGASYDAFVGLIKVG